MKDAHVHGLGRVLFFIENVRAAVVYAMKINGIKITLRDTYVWSVGEGWRYSLDLRRRQLGLDRSWHNQGRKTWGLSRQIA